MKKRILSFFFICLSVFAVAAGVGAQAQAPLYPPDKTEHSIDLLAIECQNVGDFLASNDAGNADAFALEQESFRKTIENISIMLGPAGVPEVAELWDVYAALSARSNPPGVFLARCMAVRRELQSALRVQLEAASPRTDVYDYESCVRAGYFVSNGVCFVGGTVAYDAKGYVIGRYNTDCYDANTYYSGSCWFCLYGNDGEGCFARP